MRELKKNAVLYVFLSVISCGSSYAQECVNRWSTALTTDPLQSKGMLGDTAAAYAMFAFHGDPTIKMVIKGKWPKARFMSWESYVGSLSKRHDTLLDFNMKPDSGGDSFTIEVLPDGAPTEAQNSLRLPKNWEVQSFLYRIYAPTGGVAVTEAELPQVFAYDVETGEPAQCPEYKELPIYTNVPQFVLAPVSEKPVLEFKKANPSMVGTNVAIPGYLYALSRVKKDRVVLLRLKGPSYVTGPATTTTPNVRYWSMCFVNFVKIETLSCVPDFVAKPDANGMVTIAFGRGVEVKQAADARGYNFVEDTRTQRQKVLGVLYRNVLPSEEFKAAMYQGDYLPQGILCGKQQFLDNNCQF